MNNIKLSLIIPIKSTYTSLFLIERLKKLVSFFLDYSNIEIVVIDSSSKKYANTISKICEDVSYYFLEMEDIYSASKARNYGSKLSKGEYLLFYDVDLVVQKNFIKLVLQDIDELISISKKAFTIYPCLYLSEDKTKDIENCYLDTEIFSDIKNSYLEGFNEKALYLAVNTSTILVNKEHFFEIGGYNEVFKGHGYEDFELLHRLYLSYPIVNRGDDYCLDFKTYFPYYYKGFRKYFAYYALSNFFEDKFTLHLWHPRPLMKKYYRNRTINSELFLKNLEKTLNQNLTDEFLDKNILDYYQFFDKLLIEYGFSDEKYCGLKKYNKYVKKTKGSIKRKFRKIILHPIDFIKDAIKNRLEK